MINRSLVRVSPVQGAEPVIWSDQYAVNAVARERVLERTEDVDILNRLPISSRPTTLKHVFGVR